MPLSSARKPADSSPVGPSATRPVRVFLVDDSAVIRQLVTSWLASDPGIQVMGAAADPVFAMRRLQGSGLGAVTPLPSPLPLPSPSQSPHETLAAARAADWPDVIVCDIEMPRMDGLSFLRKLMAERPTPIIIFSSLTVQGAAASFEALQAGAVAVIAKPKAAFRSDTDPQARELAAELIRHVKAAASARVAGRAALAADPPRPRSQPVMQPVPASSAGSAAASAVASPRPQPVAASGGWSVVALGASTGGTQAIERVLVKLGPTCPPLLVVQHMPEHFTALLARRLDGLCRIRVVEARDGDLLQTGVALIAPGGRHMDLQPAGSGWKVRVFDAPPVNRHRPSVDVLFRSVARHANDAMLGVLMTGMGDDGARGLLDMRQAGARTMAQDEASSVVYGMPKAAKRLGAAQYEFDLDDLAGVLMSPAALATTRLIAAPSGVAPTAYATTT